MLDLLTNAGANLANLRYNYSEIAAEHREAVKEAAVDIRQRTKRASEDILAIGRKLGEVKALLPHGQFTDWVSEEFDLSIRTAQNLMAVANRFEGKNATVALLSTSALYLLAAPSTPDAAIDAVVEYAQSNGTPTKAIVQEIVADHKPPRILNEQETEVVVWRAIKHSGVTGPSAQVDWLLGTDTATFAGMLMPGVELDHPTLERAVRSVRGQLQQQAARVPAPAQPRSVAPATVVYVTPEPAQEPSQQGGELHALLQKKIMRMEGHLLRAGWGVLYSPDGKRKISKKDFAFYWNGDDVDEQWLALKEAQAVEVKLAIEAARSAEVAQPSDDDDAIMIACPKCAAEQQDFDGFGVLHCPACGYCVHATRTGGVCDFCGDVDTSPVDNDGFSKPESSDERNSKIDSLLGIYKLVLSTLPKFEAITGCYSHAGQLRRAIDAVAEDLERNRIL